MVVGRCMAQAAHAADACRKEHGNHIDYKTWAKQTKQGFGTVIVLAASLPVIAYIFHESPLNVWNVKGYITDPDYCIRVTPEVSHLLSQNYDATFCRYTFDYDRSDDKGICISRPEVTCAYILGTKEDFSPYLDSLSLY